MDPKLESFFRLYTFQGLLVSSAT